MNPKQKGILIGIVIVALIALLGFFLLSSREEEINLDATTPPGAFDDTPDRTTPTGAQEQPPAPITFVHRFEAGTHLLSGSLMLPTPCHDIETRVDVAESFPEQVMVRFTTVAPDPEEVCAQVETRKDVNVEYQASIDASVTEITLDGEPLRFDIFEEAKA